MMANPSGFTFIPVPYLCCDIRKVLVQSNDLEQICKDVPSTRIDLPFLKAFHKVWNRIVSSLATAVDRNEAKVSCFVFFNLKILSTDALLSAKMNE